MHSHVYAYGVYDGEYVPDPYYPAELRRIKSFPDKGSHFICVPL